MTHSRHQSSPPCHRPDWSIRSVTSWGDGTAFDSIGPKTGQCRQSTNRRGPPVDACQAKRGLDISQFQCLLLERHWRAREEWDWLLLMEWPAIGSFKYFNN